MKVNVIADQPAFGDLARSHRKRAGLSTTGLAEAVRLDRSYISRIENGERTPPIPVINRLAAAFELGAGDRISLVVAAGFELGVGGR